MNGHSNNGSSNGSSSNNGKDVVVEKQLDAAECEELKSKLLSIQKRRRHVQKLTIDGTVVKSNHWLIQKQMAERERHVALEEYRAAVTCRNSKRRWLDLATKWNVTNDCFHIWHRGPFGTINGVRLASEVPSLPSPPPTPPVVDDSAAAKSSDTITKGAAIASSSSLVGSLTMTNTASVNGQNGTHRNGATTTTNKAQPAPPPQENIRVPWVEINSALGLIVLLLSTLEKKAHSGISYHNKLVPQGSTSKIGIRKGESVTFYGLFSDDSFQLFGKRSFNIALNGLLRCLVDAGEAVMKIDRTIALPHVVDVIAGGLYTIGGLSVAYGTDAKQWTRAMKYVLTDVKWLVAFTTKHVDR